MYFQLYQFIEVKVPLINTRTGDVARVQGAIVHCVSADLHMGAGVARQICQIRSYNRPHDWNQPGQCKHPIPGMLHQVWVRTSPTEPANQVFNLISKRNYWDHGNYEGMETVLKALRVKLVENNVPRVSMPMIGCGRDRLQWNRVYPLIRSALFGLVVHIDVYEL
jgi:O-acetyl-ADP-ribose deacetylase (regulator of RNase III)